MLLASEFQFQFTNKRSASNQTNNNNMDQTQGIFSHNKHTALSRLAPIIDLFVHKHSSVISLQKKWFKKR